MSSAEDWTMPTSETIDGIVIFDASDPDAGPVLHFDPETGSSTLTAGPNDIVIRFEEPSS